MHAFDVNEYHFDKIISKAIFDGNNLPAYDPPQVSLENLHLFISDAQKEDVFQKIYNAFSSEEFLDQYDRLCGDLVATLYQGNARYQSIPSARIQMPGSKSVDFHTDAFYGHGPLIRNFWLPLTPVRDSNSMYVLEDERKNSEIIAKVKSEKLPVGILNDLSLPLSVPLEMNYGQLYLFNSSMLHGTVKNESESTRVSFDFRMVVGGDSIGLKDASFFRSPGSRGQVKKQTQRIAALYFGREGLEDILPSQKYQQIILLHYCKDNGLSPAILETEFSGFDYYPNLFNILEGSFQGGYNDLLVYSRKNLPPTKEGYNRVLDICKQNDVRLHLVVEDRVIE